MAKRISFIAIITVFAILGVSRASAATFSLVIDRQSLGVGEDFTAYLYIDSQGVGINAAQGTVQYPLDILEAKSVDKSASVFNFWLQEPAIDNSKGAISFTGGSTSGFSGASLNVFKINFHVKGIGKSSITVTDGAITASDGSGTNVLVGTKGIEIGSTGQGNLSGSQATISSSSIPPVTQITRPATQAAGLPIKPEITVQAYPDPSAWYGVSTPFLVSWSLPPDVLAVATQIDKSPTSSPSKSEGLFDNKNFAALSDGIWYLHVQFKNNIGWGPVNHYRLAIDTAPPIPFEITSSSGLSSTDPAPVISFESTDPLSGLTDYSVQIDSASAQLVKENKFTLPLQSPGKHTIRVIARDKAGNSTEKTIELEIVPIESPTIDSFTKSIFVGEGGLEAYGKSIAGYSIDVFLDDIKGVQIFSKTVSTDDSGNWSVKIDDPLKKGKYVVKVVAKDSRGALSLPVQSDVITVSTRPALVIGGVGITPEALFIIIVIALIGSFVFGWFTQKFRKEQRVRKIIIAKRDIVNAFNEMENNLSLISDGIKSGGEEKIHETEYRINKLKEVIQGVKKYIVQGVEEIETDKKG